MRPHVAHNESRKIKHLHTVQEGESMTIISREYYGNPSLWKHILDANADRIKDPNEIKPGQELIIPELPK